MWDWNGTLFDDLHIVVEAVNASIIPLGVGPIDKRAYRRHYRRPVNRFYEALLGREVDDRAMAAIDRTFHDAYHAAIGRAGLAGDAVVAVDAVAAAGGTQSVLSMWFHERLVPTVHACGLAGHMLSIDGHRGAAGETKALHLARHIDQLVRVFSISRDAVVVVGDITDDAAAAAAAGVECLLFDGGSQPRTVLEGKGVPVAGSLIEAVTMAMG